MRYRSLTTLAALAVITAGLAAPAAGEDGRSATGVERALQATAAAIDVAQSIHEVPSPAVSPGRPDNPGKSDGKPDGPPQGNSERAKGLERAAQAIADGLGRANGSGLGNGRGHSAAVIEKLLNGESPAVLEPSQSHGAKVSAMVKAHNELRKQERAAG